MTTSKQIKLKQSRNLRDYKPILDGLVDDFGYIYYRAILEWCGIVGDWTDGFWRVWLVEYDGEIIGICGLYSLNPGTKELWLGWFGIIPGKRNTGIGSVVLKKIEEKAVGFGCKTLRTYIDKAGKPIPFYVRNGFKRISSVGSFILKHRLNLNEFEDRKDHVFEKQLLGVKG